MQTKLEMKLDRAVNALERIADALEEQNKPKGLGNPFNTNWSSNGVAPLNCDLGDEVHLPTASSDLITASHARDILYKPIDKPTWYNIKDDPYYTDENLSTTSY
jgi:hypothetical protein